LHAWPTGLTGDETTIAREDDMAKTIKEGDRAPGFSAASTTGGTVSLDGLRGKTVILYFYPKDDTSGCTKEACSFRDNLGRVEKLGAVVLGVSKDSLSSHEKFREKYDLNFPLLSDPEGDVISAYGAWKENKRKNGETYLGINRSTVLIDPDGVVRRIWRNVKVDGHTDEVLEAVKALG
jgi:peroxiredoxin Q/BCP